MCTRKNLALSLVLVVSLVGISYGADGILPGDGLSESTAYLIEDMADFDVFADPTNAATYWASGVYTKLACDPNLVGRPYTSAVIAPDTSSVSGFQGTPFAGVFDGDGHIVGNLTITSPGPYNDHLGLFGRIEGSTAEVKNLGVENANITGSTYRSYYLGGLCGYNCEGAITNCYATGSMATGYDCLGGLCGWNYYGTITDCYATCSVTTEDTFFHLGGLCGRNIGTLTNCYATGAVTGGDESDYLGGLCGRNGGTTTNCYATGLITGGYDSECLGGLCGINGGTTTNCYATGSITGGSYSQYRGGLCGRNNGTVTDCYATGSVTGYNYLGGLCGENYLHGIITNCYATGAVIGGAYSNTLGGLCGKNGNYDGEIINCYATGSVTGYSYLGGLCGKNCNRGEITNCYATGPITGNNNFGGLCGGNWATITDCFWDIDTGGPDNGFGTPKTMTEMQTESTFTDAGWDFTTIWDICEGMNYPNLSWRLLAGDFLCPYGVNLIDFAVLADTWGLSSGQAGYNDLCDLVDNDTIDLDDLAIFAENWLHE